jgi:hydroxymethylglutaryl-CoA lyase
VEVEVTTGGNRTLGERITIYEVGPRDGLQNETVRLSTDQKVSLVQELADAGLRNVELTSFVSPRAVPQMADAAELTARAVAARPSVRLPVLVFTERGYDRALAAGARALAIVVIASESLSLRNSRMGVKKSLGICRRLLARAREDRLWTRVYLSAAWGCPFDGPTAPDRVLALADEIWSWEPSELAVADSVGRAHPTGVGRLLEELGRRFGMDRLAVHVHGTRTRGLENAAAAISAGVRTLDSSVGGLGGCPFASGAAGNVSTEDLVSLAHHRGFETGVGVGALRRIAGRLGRLLGKPAVSRFSRGTQHAERDTPSSASSWRIR